VTCDPADKTPEPTRAAFTQIGHYEDLTAEPTTGPAKAILEVDSGLPEWTVYRPESLDVETKHAVLVWANGGCLTNGTLYGQWLLEAASYGFIAIADGKPQAEGASAGDGGQRMGSGGEPMQEVIDWITAENARPCSQYYQKIAVDKIAVSGQSCGGMMAMAAAVDERVTTAIINNSGLFARDPDLYAALHAPMAFLIGGEEDIAYANAAADVAAIDTVPIFHGNLDVGHAATWNMINGGEFGRVALSWLKWHLQGDPAAEKMFVGPDCELCKPPSEWVIEKKMMD
jgi:Chlorophyllase enzyme